VDFSVVVERDGGDLDEEAEGGDESDDGFSQEGKAGWLEGEEGDGDEEEGEVAAEVAGTPGAVAVEGIDGGVEEEAADEGGGYEEGPGAVKAPKGDEAR